MMLKGLLLIFYTNISIVQAKLICPQNFLNVGPNKDLKTIEFCVGAFEGKKGKQNSAVIAPEDRPWVMLTRKDAIEACKKLGAGYDLISNNEWQTIGHEIEKNPLNWSSHVIGEGYLNNGHSDNNPSEVEPVNKSEPCLTSPKNCLIEKWKQNRRYHFINHNQVIWDFAGNAWEFVKDDVPREFLKILPTDFGSFGQDSRFNILNSKKVLDFFGPLLKVKTWHQGYGFIGKVGDGPVFVRGGNVDDFFMSGIYSGGVGAPLDVTHEAVGFRCVFK